MNVTSIHQLININPASDINTTAIASEAESQTTSLLEAIKFISLKIMEMSDGKKDNNKKVNPLSIVIADLACLAITTNKISNEASYYSGLKVATKNHTGEASQYALAAHANVAENNLTTHPTPAENIKLPYASTIGERIRELRKARGFTQTLIAEEVCVLRGTVNQWEDGTYPVESTYILPLANALKCDPMWLLTGNNPEVAE